MKSSNWRTNIRISLILCRSIMLRISLTLFRMVFFGAAHGWGRAKKTSLLPKIFHTYPAIIKLGTVIPYLKKIQKTNWQKRYQQSATFVVIRNFLISDLKNDVFKISFQSLNAAKTILKLVYSLGKVCLQLYRVIYYNYVGYPVKLLILAASLLSWNVLVNFMKTVFHLE